MGNYALILLQAPSRDSGHDWIIAVILLLLVIPIGAMFSERPSKEIKHTEHFFDGILLSANDVYTEVKTLVGERQMPDVEFSIFEHDETHLLSSKREYLRVSRGDYLIDVCCAQFGKGSYVSWRLAKYDPGLISRIPLLNSVAGKNPKYQTYYQADTAAMFYSVVDKIVHAVVEGKVSEQGIRPSRESQHTAIAEP